MVDSAGPDSCGCKGIRSCLICENYGGKQRAEDICHSVLHFNYEPSLELAVRNEDGTEESFHFPGVFLWENFLSEEEERELVRCMDQDAWKESQSGRKKQDFGPKVNFKKQRVRLGNFNGLPALSRNIVHRMSQEPLLQGFQPVEQCNLDYSPQRGSAIDPHLDDSWLWGERLVTVNMLSNTIITMSHEEGLRELRVYVNFPRRSLLVLHGDARHKWKHAIHRKDINQRRVCSTFRELSPAFLSGGEYEHIGSQLLGLAHCFQGSPV